MVELIEENPKITKLKSYLTILGILFITFVIPVTLTQFYQTTNVSSSAATITNSPTIQATHSPIITQLYTSPTTVTPTITTPSSINQFVNQFVFPHLILYLVIFGLIVIWCVLVGWYFIERKRSL